MARYIKKKHNKKKRLSVADDLDLDKRSANWELSSDTKKGIFIIILFVISALSILGLFDLSGDFGRLLFKGLGVCFGGLKWIFPVITALLGYFLLRSGKYEVKFVNYVGIILLLLGITSLSHLRFEALESIQIAQNGLGGGFVGVALSLPLLNFMGFWGAIIVSTAVFLIGLLLTFETSIYGLMWPVRLFKLTAQKSGEFYDAFNQEASKRDSLDDDENYEEESDDEEILAEDESEEVDDVPQFVKTDVEQMSEPKESAPTPEVIEKPKKFGRKIELPLELLTSKSSKPTSGDIKMNQEIIRRTLSNFGIPVEMGEVMVGPTVTQYTLRPADGVRLSKIINLNSDLALALATHPIRIEAPIPGKALVGVEVPNQLAAKVTMAEILGSKEFKERSNNLNIALGKDVSGRAIFAPLDKMPHLLIAGATGSGKSVCINSIIISLLYQNSPDDLKFILVDPKRVELPGYNNIPYLLTPVINDVKKTISALKWTIVEMERRFEVLSRKGKRNIESYNSALPPLSADRLPYIVFIIDELADLMSTAGSDMEAGIVRLAQMSRAVGIHLILATQRPSVEVITGLIKANIPGRIAFSVASLIDSRTILDCSGAEKLVGRGDMLYLGPNVMKPKRIQGVYLSDKEIRNVIDYIKDQGEAQYVEGVVDKNVSLHSTGGAFASDDGDSLLGEAKEIIREAGKASASLLQRRLKIGYSRAARILDLLEEQGVIGPADGAKPREVFLDQLGGVDDVVGFAAREYDLEGELAPSYADASAGDASTPTVFSRGPVEPAGDMPDEAEEELEAAFAQGYGEPMKEMQEELEEEDRVESGKLKVESEEETGADIFSSNEVSDIRDEISEVMESENEQDEQEDEIIEDDDVEETELDEDPEDEMPKVAKGKKDFSEDEWT